MEVGEIEGELPREMRHKHLLNVFAVMDRCAGLHLAASFYAEATQIQVSSIKLDKLASSISSIHASVDQ